MLAEFFIKLDSWKIMYDQGNGLVSGLNTGIFTVFSGEFYASCVLLLYYNRQIIL